MTMRIAVIIPALNEEAAIGGVVGEVPRDLAGEGIVVDNCSTDRTAERARAAGARVVHEPERAYGAACMPGVRAAGNADLLVFLDGDRNEDPAEMGQVLAQVIRMKPHLFENTPVIGHVLVGIFHQA